jgi:hypothetical protein
MQYFKQIRTAPFRAPDHVCQATGSFCRVLKQALTIPQQASWRDERDHHAH